MLSVAPRYGRGAATLEFQIVALFALLPLCLGTLQLALLLAENHHIDHAAFMAARRAAMAQGDLDTARNAFAQGALPLLLDSSEEVAEGNLTARVATAYAAVRVDLAAFARFRLISPDADAQSDFAINRDGGRVIPNDALAYRSTQPGQKSGLTVQQANLLRLEVTWCRPLIVPFARELLLGLLRTVDRDAWHNLCYAAGRIPIRSEGISAMQSDFRVSS